MQILNLSKLTKCVLQAIPLCFSISPTPHLQLPLNLFLTASGAPLAHGITRNFSSLLISENAQGPDLHPFFLVSRFGMATPTDTSVSMDPGAEETIDRNGSFGWIIKSRTCSKIKLNPIFMMY